MGSDQDRLENSCPSRYLPSVRANTQEKWPQVVLKLWESTIDPGLAASDLLKGHFQGLDEVPRILITIPKRMEIDREPYEMLSWPSKSSKVEIKNHLKKTYKILGRKHQKARIPWKSWDSVSKIYVPTTKFPTPHHLVLKTIATSPTHCTKPQAKPSVQSSMPQLMRMKPSVMPTWPPFSMYVQVRHWLRTIRNNQTRLYTFYDIIHVYST